MPRKVNYGVDYEEDLYDYEDYNYDYDDGYDSAEKNGKVPGTNTKQELVKAGIWHCPICTFDNKDTMNVCDVCGNTRQEPVKAGVWRCPICTFNNEDTMNVCDICGVLRNPLIKGCRDGKASAATVDQVLQSNAPSSKKEKATKVKQELVAEGLASSSASTAKVRRDNVKVRGSSIETRENHGVTSDMSNTSIPLKPCNTEIRSATSRSQSKPQKVVRADQLEDKLDQLNLAIVGHVDSGKSTLSGRLLHLLGQISQKEMHKYEKEAKQQAIVLLASDLFLLRHCQILII